MNRRSAMAGIAAAGATPLIGGRNIVEAGSKSRFQDLGELLQRVVVTSVLDTLAGGFLVFIQRAGQGSPDGQGYRYLGPAPTVGDDAVMFKVGTGYIVAGIDETVLDRMVTQVTSNNTVAEVTMYEKNVPMNTMSLTRGVELFAGMATDVLADPGSNGTSTWRLYVNNVLFKSLGGSSWLTGGGGFPNTINVFIDTFRMHNRNSLNSQIATLRGTAQELAALTLNSAADIPLKITVQSSLANVNVVNRLELVTLARS